MSISAMKQALEALEQIHPGNMTPMAEEAWNKSITALRQAIEQAEKQEPAFYVIPATDRFGEGYEQTFWEDPAGFPVYTRPVYASDISQEPVDETAKDRHEWVEQPDLARVGEVGVWNHQREWVGLTDEEIMDRWPNETRIEFARFIEAKLKEKNT